MRRHVSKSFVLAVTLVVALPSMRASAQIVPNNSFVSAQDAMPFSLQGKITRLEAGKFTVNTEENILFHVRYDDKTSITLPDGSAGSEKDLKTGTWVQVRGDLEESGEIAAATIKLLDKEPPKD